MTKKVSTGKTIFKIACATGGAVLASGVGLPWLGAMAGSCLPKVLEGSLDFLVSAVEDDKKQEVLASLLQKPIEQLASIGVNFSNDRIEGFLNSHFEAKDAELNFDLPRAVVKVWEESLNKMLRAERDSSTLGLKRNDEFEKARKELLTFWRRKLRKAESDNDLLKEFFGKKPDYFLDIEKGKASLIDVLPDQKQVEKFFWQRIEESFTTWATIEEKFPKDWTNSIHQSLKDELKQNLFRSFSSVLKDKLKENERAWKSFEFASSLQTVSMLQSLASNIDQIKDDTTNIKQDLIDLIQSLPLMMKIILKRFDNLDKHLKDLLVANNIITELLFDFRKEVSEKLSEIGKDVSETKDYTKQAAKNTEKSFKNLVTFQKWREKRLKNRIENKFEYIETSSTNDFIKSFTNDIFSSPKHYILKGDISTGKSTIIKQIGETLLKIDENVKIIILPLTREFQLVEGWQRKDSCEEFNNYLRHIAQSKSSKTLFIVEDAHEGGKNLYHNWAENLENDFSSVSSAEKLSLSHIPLLVTTRPDNFEEVKDCLKEFWKIENPKVHETKPEDIISKIIFSQSALETTTKKLRDSYLKCGKILLIFNEIIEGWKKDNKPIEGNFMIYAYKAVYEEFNRVLPEHDLNNESAWLTLAMIWMAGGLELSIDESFINSNFHVLAKPLWKQLEKSNEIHLDDDDKYLTSRHPAWGLLTITALDNYRNFSSIRQLMREGFLKNLEEDLPPEKEKEIKSAKPSVLLMTALLNSEITTPKALGFYCGGRHIHDEFIASVGYYMDICLSKPEASKESISEILLSLAANVRHSNTKGRNAYDPIQRQEVIKEGYERLTECIKLREELFGKNLETDQKKGEILYEEGYYQLLKGDFVNSSKTFRLSRESEIDSGISERQHYAAMSGIMEANALIWAGELDNAINILSEMVQILESITNDEKVLCRFRCNSYGAYAEFYLAQENIEKASEFVNKFVAEGQKVNLYVNDYLYKSRILLLQKEGQKAERLIRKALADNELMNEAENKMFAHRILGDALLLQNKKDEAYREYNMILPPMNSDCEYLDFNLRIIKARMKKLDDGETIKEAFQGIRI